MEGAFFGPQPASAIRRTRTAGRAKRRVGRIEILRLVGWIAALWSRAKPCVKAICAVSLPRMRALRWVLVVDLLASGGARRHVAPGPPATVPQAGEKPAEPERPSVPPSAGQARPGYEKRLESL